MDLIHTQKGDSSDGGGSPHPLMVLISPTVAGISDCSVVILPPPNLNHFLIRIIFSDTQTQELIRGPATAGARVLLLGLFY